jgi:hypothetical protein
MATSYFLNLMAIVISFYQFASPERNPRLTLAEDQTRTEVVKKERSSQLKVLFGGDEIAGPVSVAQLTFWNDGAMPVRTDDILSPIVISLPETRILEASVIKKSRNEAGIRLDSTEATAGKLRLDWRILEKGDGCQIQVIYAGDTTVPTNIGGSVVHQKVIERFVASKNRLSTGTLLSFTFVAVCLTWTLGGLAKDLLATTLSSRPILYFGWGFAIFGLLFTGGYGYALYKAWKSWLPSEIPTFM